jgi:protoheme IX farnesyltransferase
MSPRPERGSPAASVLALCKPGVSLLAAFSALAGFMLASPEPSWRLVIPSAGVLLLAGGAGAFNQYQERVTDGRMERTKGRPIPSGRIAPRRALKLAVLLMLLGLAVLGSGGPGAALLGILAVAWYNAVYTPLKKSSPFAAVPGALTGAFPPAIGWLCGGGGLGDPRLYALCLILFAWQVPHFWLIVLDRGGEYEEAGLPGLTEILTDAQVRRVISHWVLGTAACSLVLCLGSALRAPATRYALCGLSLWLAVQAVSFGLGPRRAGAFMFRRLNRYMVGLLALACGDRLLFLLGIL